MSSNRGTGNRRSPMETKLPQQPKHRKVLAIGDLMAQMRVAWESIRAQREGIRAHDAISKPNQRHLRFHPTREQSVKAALDLKIPEFCRSVRSGRLSTTTTICHSRCVSIISFNARTFRKTHLRNMSSSKSNWDHNSKG